MIIYRVDDPGYELKDFAYQAERCGCIADILAEISRLNDTLSICVDARKGDVERMIKRYKDKYGEDDYNVNPYYIRTLEALLFSFGERDQMSIMAKIPKFRG